MSEATKRPWIVGIDENLLGSVITEKVYSIYDSKIENFICDTGSVKNETALANAELIVKAVNRDHLFDELVTKNNKLSHLLRGLLSSSTLDEYSKLAIKKLLGLPENYQWDVEDLLQKAKAAK